MFAFATVSIVVIVSVAIVSPAKEKIRTQPRKKPKMSRPNDFDDNGSSVMFRASMGVAEAINTSNELSCHYNDRAIYYAKLAQRGVERHLKREIVQISKAILALRDDENSNLDSNIAEREGKMTELKKELLKLKTIYDDAGLSKNDRANRD